MTNHLDHLYLYYCDPFLVKIKLRKLLIIIDLVACLLDMRAT